MIQLAEAGCFEIDRQRRQAISHSVIERCIFQSLMLRKALKDDLAPSFPSIAGVLRSTQRPEHARST